MERSGNFYKAIQLGYILISILIGCMAYNSLYEWQVQSAKPPVHLFKTKRFYFELQIPQAASSKAITDLQKMMSEIEDISCNNEWCHIKGKVPLNTSKDYASEVSSYTKGLGIFMVKPCGYQITKGGYSDNIRMNEKDKLLFMFQKSMSSK